MKKKIFIMIKISLVFVAVCIFTACNDTIENVTHRDSKGISVVPNPMTIGGQVSISGPNFGSATAVVFPGGITVTDLTKYGDQINLIVPASTSSSGQITVKLSDGDFIIPMDVKIVSTSIKSVATIDKNPEGLCLAGFDDELTVNGEGLSAIIEAIFPGGVSMMAMDFRKSETSIIFSVPFGVDKAVGRLKLVSASGQVLETEPIDFSGVPMPEELIPLCGEAGQKIWTWDYESGWDGKIAFYLGSVSEGGTAQWWTQYTMKAGEGEGARMVFGHEKRFGGRLTLLRTNGTEGQGKFEMDPQHRYRTGQYNATGRILTSRITVLHGVGSDGAAPNAFVDVYDILKLDDQHLVLAYPNNMTADNFTYDAWDGCTYWFFKAVEE